MIAINDGMSCFAASACNGTGKTCVVQRLATNCVHSPVKQIATVRDHFVAGVKLSHLLWCWRRLCNYTADRFNAMCKLRPEANNVKRRENVTQSMPNAQPTLAL